MKRPQVGDIVAVTWQDAVIRDGNDGGMFALPTAITYGKVVRMEKDYISIPHEEFIDLEMKGSLRGVTSIPWKTVTEWNLLL